MILPCTPQSDTNRLRPRTTAGWRWGVPRNGAPRLADCNFTVRRDKSFADDLVERPGRVRSRVALLLRATERKPDAALICDSPEDGASSLGSGGAWKRGQCGPATAPYGSSGRVTCPTCAAGSSVAGRAGGRVTPSNGGLGAFRIDPGRRARRSTLWAPAGGRPGDTLIGALERGGGRCPGGRCAPRLRRPEKLRLGARTVECPVGWCLSPL